MSTLGLVDLDARLDRSLDLLGDGRTASLRRTIAWSYELLPDHEQRLFRHLGVFPDGFDLATAESVAVDLSLPADPAGALAHLVDASMIDVTLGDVVRYRMLETSAPSPRTGSPSRGGRRRHRAVLPLGGRPGNVVRADDRSDEEALADRMLRREIVSLGSAWRLVRRHERLGDAVRLAVGFGDASTWRDVTEVWEWARELADDDPTKPILMPQPCSRSPRSVLVAW